MMRRLLIALMALVMIGGVAGVTMAAPPGSDGPGNKGNCGDGIDNDGDNLIDTADPGCDQPGCEPSGIQPKKCQEDTDAVDPCLSLGGDVDGDGVCGDDDNCPSDANEGQEDSDEDGIGDACDTCEGDNGDNDGDGICDGEDECPADAQNDADGDGVCGDQDNCPATANPGQEDTDEDGKGDACDPACDDLGGDADGDGVCGNTDNCPTTANPGQEDTDGDGIGDACDPPDEFDPCSQFGLLEARAIAQILWDAGIQIPFLTEDPDHDGLVSGALVGLLKGTPLEDTPIDQLVLEVSCLADFLIEYPNIPLDV